MPEPDQPDQELDDHRDVGDACERPDQQEGGRDCDKSHEQRDERHERTEDKGQDEERAQRSHQGSQQNADAITLVLAGRSTKRIEPRHLNRGAADLDTIQRPLCGKGLFLAGVDSTLGRDVDQRKRGATIIGDERPIAGRGIGSSHRLRQRRLHSRESSGELRADAGRIDSRPLRERHHRHDRRDVPAGAVDGRKLLVGLEPLASRDAELLRESAAGGSNRGEGCDRDQQPEANNDSLVVKNPSGQAGHGRGGFGGGHLCLSWGTNPGCAPPRRCTIRHAPEPTLIFAPLASAGGLARRSPRPRAPQHWRNHWRAPRRFALKARCLQQFSQRCTPLSKPRALVRFRPGALSRSTERAADGRLTQRADEPLTFVRFSDHAGDQVG